MTDLHRTGMEPETFQPVPRVSENGELFAAPIVSATDDGTALDSVSPLLPCPFCGGEARIAEDGGQFKVECRQCGCDQYGEFELEAIVAWNRRVVVATEAVALRELIAAAPTVSAQDDSAGGGE